MVLEVFVCKMVVGLSMSAEDFTADRQESFRQGIAVTAGVIKANVKITSIDPMFRRLRHLLSGSISISTEVVVEDASQGVLVSSQMTAENINAQMRKVGLPEVEMLQTPEVAVVQVVVASSVTTSSSESTPVPSSALVDSTEMGSTPAAPSAESELKSGDLPRIQSKRMIEGWKIGIIVGAVCFMMFLSVLILIRYRRRAKNSQFQPFALTGSCQMQADVFYMPEVQTNSGEGNDPMAFDVNSEDPSLFATHDDENAFGISLDRNQASQRHDELPSPTFSVRNFRTQLNKSSGVDQSDGCSDKLSEQFQHDIEAAAAFRSQNIQQDFKSPCPPQTWVVNFERENAALVLARMRDQGVLPTAQSSVASLQPVAQETTSVLSTSCDLKDDMYALQVHGSLAAPTLQAVRPPSPNGEGLQREHADGSIEEAICRPSS